MRARRALSSRKRRPNAGGLVEKCLDVATLGRAPAPETVLTAARRAQAAGPKLHLDEFAELTAS
jgi:hypothetical protein